MSKSSTLMRVLTLGLLLTLCAGLYKETVHNLFSTLERNLDPMPAVLNGTIPPWLQLTRRFNGFGQFEGGQGKDAWRWAFLFDATAYTGKWEVKDGAVVVAAQMTNGSYYQEGEEHIPLFRTFGGTQPAMSIGQTIKTLTNSLLSDNYNVNIVPIGKHLLSISDMEGQNEIDPVTMKSLGKFHYNDPIENETTAVITCAHPSKLPGDPFIYNYVTRIVPQNLSHMIQRSFYRVDTRKEPLSREVVYVDNSAHSPPYMHQFGNTENYIIFINYPLWWHVVGIAASTKVLPNMKWDPSQGTTIQVLDKKTWAIHSEFKTDAVFAYHHVNSWEDSTGDVWVDIMTVDCDHHIKGEQASCHHMNAFELDTLKSASFEVPRGPMRRFHLPVHTGGKAVWEDINYDGLDLMSIHPMLKGKKHRYVWAMGNQGDSSWQGVWWNSVVKFDTESNSTIQWYKEDHYPSEVSFVPRPGAVREDDGVLITTVLSVPDRSSYLLILDAKDLSFISTASAPIFFPFPSHGHTCAPVDGKDMCYWA